MKLKELLCCVFQDLRRLQRELDVFQREQRRQHRDEQLCGLTPRAQRVCIAVYILSSYKIEMAAAFAEHASQCRKRKLAERSVPGDWPVQIRQWFRELPREVLYKLQEPESKQEKSICVEARKFIAKWQTAHWVTEQNYQCGVAPTYASVAEHYHGELDRQDHGHVSERLLTSAHGRDGKAGIAGRHARAWCNRFCKRFALIRGRLATKATISWEELEDKAWTVHVASFCTW